MLILRSTMAVALITASAAFGQSPATPSFEVASVKSAAPCCAPGQWRESQAGEDRIDFRYVTMRYCIAFAYRLKEYQISGPAWLGETRYDIVAKAAAGTRHDQLPEMMQALLADRFQLQVHHEKKEFNVYALLLGKNGPKLKESPPEAGGSDGAAIGLSMSPSGAGRLEVRHGNMLSLANTVSRLVGRPVVDMTGLTARYDFEVEYSHEDLNGMLTPADSGGAPASTAELGASIFTSIQQLGLKLEAQKTMLDSIVVDRGEKSFTEN